MRTGFGNASVRLVVCPRDSLIDDPSFHVGIGPANRASVPGSGPDRVRPPTGNCIVSARDALDLLRIERHYEIGGGQPWDSSITTRLLLLEIGITLFFRVVDRMA